MVRVVVGVPNYDVQERLLFGIQDLFHLLVSPDHAKCPAVPIPPPWLEVGGHLFHILNHQHYHKVLINIYTFWLV